MIIIIIIINPCKDLLMMIFMFPSKKPIMLSTIFYMFIHNKFEKLDIITFYMLMIYEFYDVKLCKDQKKKGTCLALASSSRPPTRRTIRPKISPFTQGSLPKNDSPGLS